MVTPTYLPHYGGVETHVGEIAKRLAARHDLCVITADRRDSMPEDEMVGGVKVKRFSSYGVHDAVYASPPLFRYLQEHSNDYDIVHAHNYHALPSLFAAVTRGSNSFVFTPHFHGIVGHTTLGKLFFLPYSAIGSQIFRRSDRILCCNNFEARSILRFSPESRQKLRKIREGIVAQGVNRKTQRSGRLLLCVSRLEKYKGIQHIIRALPLLPGFRLRIVGTGSYLSALLELANSIGVDDRIEFTANVSASTLGGFYQETDVAVLMSEHEQYGLFIGEALSGGVPCVVAKRDALTEWLEWEGCIGVDDPEDSSELAGAIKESLGKTTSSAMPTWDDYVEKLEDIYLQVA